MMKFVAAALAAFLLLLAGIALTSSNETYAGLPTDTPTTAPTDTPTPAPTSPAATSPAATSPAATTAAAGTATPTPTRLPAAAPQTGGDPGSGSDTLLLTLILGGAAIIGVSGVFAGKYALDRRS